MDLNSDRFKEHRIREYYGDELERKNKVELSIIANEMAYCTPRKWCDDFNEYTAVEMAIFLDGEMVLPGAVDLPQYNSLWEPGSSSPVGGYIPMKVCHNIRTHLTDLYGWKNREYKKGSMIENGS